MWDNRNMYITVLWCVLDGYKLNTYQSNMIVFPLGRPILIIHVIWGSHVGSKCLHLVYQCPGMDAFIDDFF